MAAQARRSEGASTLNEMREFAGFSKAEQRYIRRSLDVGLGRRDAMKRWARNVEEAASIRAQGRSYQRLEAVRTAIPRTADVEELDALMAPLIVASGFDLAQRRLGGFGPYRFLYERLVGAAARPWLPGAFCAAASLPHIHPTDRLALLKSMNEAVATATSWSTREPAFYPEWVEKIDLALPA